MNVTPFDEKDLPKNLLEKGEYDFEVTESADMVSRNGNEMIKLKIAVWVGEKVRCYLFDYLLDALPAKLRHACDSFGLLDKYQSGNLKADDFYGRTGKGKIGIKSDSTGQYPDKNIISDYVCRGTKPLQQKNTEQFSNDDSDMPF
jgi:hypothetical protein